VLRNPGADAAKSRIRFQNCSSTQVGYQKCHKLEQFHTLAIQFHFNLNKKKSEETIVLTLMQTIVCFLKKLAWWYGRSRSRIKHFLPGGGGA
jgi:hypothetical protein